MNDCGTVEVEIQVDTECEKQRHTSQTKRCAKLFTNHVNTTRVNTKKNLRYSVSFYDGITHVRL